MRPCRAVSIGIGARRAHPSVRGGRTCLRAAPKARVGRPTFAPHTMVACILMCECVGRKGCRRRECGREEGGVAGFEGEAQQGHAMIPGACRPARCIAPHRAIVTLDGNVAQSRGGLAPACRVMCAHPL